MNITYKGYTASVYLDAVDNMLYGEVVGIKDVISIRGESVSEIKEDLAGSIDFYIDSCKRRGKSPNKPYSGKFVTRISPETHKHASIAAADLGISLNKFVESAIAEKVESSQLAI